MNDSRQWSRLDNAAKIFPPTTTIRDSKVFRAVCELYEEVDGDVLQRALDKTMILFPHYSSILKKGLFWFYFEKSTLKPIVQKEEKPPCRPIYDGDKKGLLFNITYYKCRINLEIYHALSDGTGAFQFMKALVSYYIDEKYEQGGESNGHTVDDDASDWQRNNDSFSKYYKKSPKPKEKEEAAYQQRGEIFPEFRVGVIEGLMSVNEIRNLSATYNATVSEYLTAVLIMAIHDGMSYSDEKKPVVISVPVNLRRFFPSESARNYFGLINIAHNFRTQGGFFDDILESVKKSYHEQLKPEAIAAKTNALVTIEQNLLTKIIPLIIKIPSLRFANLRKARCMTMTFSNVGKIVMHERFSKYIRLFDLFNRSKKNQICVCSYLDKMVINFASPFINSDVQRCFFRELAQHDIRIEVTTNLYEV